LVLSNVSTWSTWSLVLARLSLTSNSKW
jgi:hypothetical protein